MKRIKYWHFVTLFTFMLGVVAVMFWMYIKPSSLHNSNELYADLPILDYCELANNPEKYDGKIVRINSKLYGAVLHHRFEDVNCYSKEKESVVTFSDDEVVEKINHQVQPQEMDKKQLRLAYPKIIAVGKFSRVKPSSDIKSVEYDTHLRG